MSSNTVDSIKADTTALKARRLLFQANVHPSPPTDDALKTLDSSMKKNTALVRKLRQVTEDSKQSILTDISKTNQSKYVSEAAAAFAEGPIKSKDIQAAIEVCSVLHQRYQDFSAELMPALLKLLQPTARGIQTDEDKISAVKKRLTLRLVVELLLCGVCASHAALLTLLTQIAAVDFQKDLEGPLTALSLITTFAKSAREDLLGLPRRPPAALPADLAEQAQAGDATAMEVAAALAEYRAEAALVHTFPEEAVKKYKGVVDQVFDRACAALEQYHVALVETEMENERVLNNRGDLPESLAAAYEAQRNSFETLQRGVSALGDVLDRELPDLRAAVTRMATVVDESQNAKLLGADIDSQNLSPFEDEESRAFYETIPDLTVLVPAVLLGRTGEEDTEEQAGEAGVEDKSTEQDNGATVVTQQLGAMNLTSKASADTEGTAKKALELVFAKLPGAVSRELCDELAVAFCYAGGAGRGARKRMSKTLCDPPAGALQLLPHYARVVAVLQPAFPDIAATVIAVVENDFIEWSRKKDATSRTLEPRLRCARYIAELVKFKLFPVGNAFSLLKSLLDDFSGHNVDAACAFVEWAGRYLSRCPGTATRINNMLEVMMRLKNVRNLDARQAGLVEAAYFTVKIIESGAPRKQKPPQQQYIDHLVHERLAQGTVTQVMKKLRRLSWAEHEVYILNTLIEAVRKGRHSQLPLVASLAAGLARYHPAIGVGIVDTTLEDVMTGLESPDSGFYQSRIASIKFLGELYAFKLIGSSIIFSTLRLLVSFGHDPGTPPETSNRLDPPANFFRIRLVCALLENCGIYFTKGPARRQLDAFLPYLQMYVLSKPPLALDVDMDLQELYAKLKVDPPNYASFTEAAAAVAALEAKRANETASGLRPIEEDDVETGEGDDDLDDEDSCDEEEGVEGEWTGGDNGGESTEEEDDADDDEYSDSDDEVSSESEDEVDVILRRPKTVEDDAFELELAAALGEATSTLVLSPRTKGSRSHHGPADDGGRETMSFHVMVRRGGREDKSKETVQIPVSAGVVQNLKEKEAQEAAERAELKRLVLEADRRDEQDEIQQQGGGAGRKGRFRMYSNASGGRNYR